MGTHSREVLDELLAAVDEGARTAGVDPTTRLHAGPWASASRKRLEDNLALLAALPDLVRPRGYPLTVLGCSRKSFLGQITGREVDAREHATTATTVWGALCGVSLIRVHDVEAAVDALAVIEAITAAGAVARPSADR